MLSNAYKLKLLIIFFDSRQENNNKQTNFLQRNDGNFAKIVRRSFLIRYLLIRQISNAELKRVAGCIEKCLPTLFRELFSETRASTRYAFEDGRLGNSASNSA